MTSRPIPPGLAENPRIDESDLRVCDAPVARDRYIDFGEIAFQSAPNPVRADRRPATRRGAGAQAKALSTSPRNVRARIRRRKKLYDEGPTKSEIESLYRKPVSQWDIEELAMGRPRDHLGTFRGGAPQWLTRAMHEEATSRFHQLIRQRMNMSTKDALGVLDWIISSQEADSRGRPLVNASTKLDAIKYLIDHSIGKPTQRIESDISVRLQGVLAAAIVSPNQLPALPPSQDPMPAHLMYQPEPGSPEDLTSALGISYNPTFPTLDGTPDDDDSDLDGE